MQGIATPLMMKIGGQRSGIANATLHSEPLASSLVACIRTDIIDRKVNPLKDIGRHVQLQSLYIAFVAVLVSRIAFQFASLVVCHLWELLA